MASNIVLKTFKGGNVTPQNDAIIYQTVIPGAGIFKGCEVTSARGNILHISQGYGMIKGRFFEVYENEVSVVLAETGSTLRGRVYIHLDLSNADEPIQILTKTAETLPSLDADQNLNFNNSSYDLELAVFGVDSTGIRNLTQTFTTLQGGGGAGGGGGAASLMRETSYVVGQTVTAANAPAWCTLVCTQAGMTATIEPQGYTQITKVDDKVLDGSCVFTARDTYGEIDALTSGIVDAKTELSKLQEDFEASKSDADEIVLRMMSITDYKKLSSYDSKTMYYCYDSEDTHEIKFIYLGQHVVYATGINITYQVDTNNAITQVAALSNDIVASAPAVSKAGYTFVGWKSDTNADGEVLKNYYLNSANAVKLYAVFKKTITIDMDPMDADIPKGADEPASKANLYYNNGKVLSDEVTIPDCPYTMEGKMFCGWTIDPQKGESYMPGVNYTFTQDETLYPCFVEPDYDFTNNYTSYTNFRIPATGIYEFECWGAEGGHASGAVDGTTLEAKGGKGGHAKVYKKMKKGQMLYVYLGGHPNGTNSNNVSNIGGNGNSYASTKHFGAAGGGATYVSSTSVGIQGMSDQSRYYSNYKNEIIVIAGGGGGAGISATTYSNSTPKNNYEKGPHNGGYAGGEKGEDGSSGSRGGHQTSESYYEYTGWGYIASPTSTSQTYSGGGSGWFAGDYGLNGNSGAGGSSYVGNNPTFTYNGVRYKTVNESNKNEGHGKAHIRFVLPCVVE